MSAFLSDCGLAGDDTVVRRVFEGLFAPGGPCGPDQSCGATSGVAEPTSVADAPPAVRILFVDDERHIVLASTRLLERAGYAVSGFMSSAEAIERLRLSGESYDVLVSDLKMPGASGLEVAREAVAANAGIAILLISGSLLTEEMAGEATRLGVSEVLLKPVRIERLVRAIESAVGTTSGAD